MNAILLATAMFLTFSVHSIRAEDTKSPAPASCADTKHKTSCKQAEALKKSLQQRETAPPPTNPSPTTGTFKKKDLDEPFMRRLR